MSKSAVNTSLVALSMLLLLVGVLYFHKGFGGQQTAIEVIEKNNALYINAAYPENMSKKVQDHLQAYLNMNDLSDLQDVEIRNYTTPDRQLNFNISTNDGEVKIWLDKKDNNRFAYAKLKATGESLKQVLVQ